MADPAQKDAMTATSEITKLPVTSEKGAEPTPIPTPPASAKEISDDAKPAAEDSEPAELKAPPTESTPANTSPPRGVELKETILPTATVIDRKSFEKRPSSDKRLSSDKPPSTKAPSLNTNLCGLPPEEARDFQGEVAVTNDLPSAETLKKIGDYIVLDRHGKTQPFKSLYMGRNVARRVLVIFVRHFFCGMCQEYLRTLSAAITPDALLNLPISTFIAVVGCGAPELIDTYAAETNCPFPIYADPTRKLYDALGMVRTLSMGARPAYIKKSLAQSVVSGVVQGLKQIKTGLVTKAGDQKQVGGEFLFEPYTATTPMTEMPTDKSPFGVSRKISVGFNSLGDGTKKEDIHKERDGIEEKRVSWCHRMRTTRDHAEIPELMEVLGLESDATHSEGVDPARWTKALEERKGTGLSLASEMSRMSKEWTEVPSNPH